MRVLKLTKTGFAIASNPSSSRTPAMRALYFMRNRGYKATDEQLKDYLGNDYAEALRNITSGQSPAAVFE